VPELRTGARRLPALPPVDGALLRESLWLKPFPTQTGPCLHAMSDSRQRSGLCLGPTALGVAPRARLLPQPDCHQLTWSTS